MVLFHLHKSLDLFIDDLHDVLGHALALQVGQKFFDLVLLLICLVGEVLLETLVDLFKLLLCLGLVFLEIILFFQFIPKLQFIHETGE